MPIRVTQSQIISRLINGDNWNKIAHSGDQRAQSSFLAKTHLNISDAKQFGRIAERITGEIRVKALGLNLQWGILERLASSQVSDEEIMDFLQKAMRGSYSSENVDLIKSIQRETFRKQQKLLLEEIEYHEELPLSSEEEFLDYLESLADSIDTMSKSMSCLCNLLTDEQLEKRQSLNAFLQPKKVVQ